MGIAMISILIGTIILLGIVRLFIVVYLKKRYTMIILMLTIVQFIAFVGIVSKIIELALGA